MHNAGTDTPNYGLWSLTANHCTSGSLREIASYFFFFLFFIFFFFNDTSTTEIYTLSLHDALPIFHGSENQSSLQIIETYFNKLAIQQIKGDEEIGRAHV